MQTTTITNSKCKEKTLHPQVSQKLWETTKLLIGLTWTHSNTNDSYHHFNNIIRNRQCRCCRRLLETMKKSQMEFKLVIHSINPQKIIIKMSTTKATFIELKVNHLIVACKLPLRKSKKKQTIKTTSRLQMHTLQKLVLKICLNSRTLALASVVPMHTRHECHPRKAKPLAVYSSGPLLISYPNALLRFPI